MTARSGAPALPYRDAYCMLGQRQFRAMNTNVHLYVRDAEESSLLPAAEDVFHAMEARLSRFRPESELCRLNERSGRETPVSGTMFRILARAIEMHGVTGGAFDPAVLPDLEAAGYDRSFERVAVDSAGGVAPAPAGVLSLRQVRLDASRRTVTAPAGLRIDLGGIGKGYAVDAAARVLEAARDFAVNAGGDIIARGRGPDGDGWLIAVTDPMTPAGSIAQLRLYGEALATSTTAVRRWQRGGRLFHHLIDPRTRHPSESGVMSVSVVARTATEADVFAKTALLLGVAEGGRFLEAQSAEGLFVMDDGSRVCTPRWRGTPAC